MIVRSSVNKLFVILYWIVGLPVHVVDGRRGVQALDGQERQRCFLVSLEVFNSQAGGLYRVTYNGV